MNNPMLLRAVAEELALWPAAWPGSRRDAAAETTVQVFAEAVEGCALAAIPKAGRRLRRDSKYFPTPAEFYAAVRAIEREEAERERALFGTPVARGDGRDTCVQCGGRYEWRQLLDANGEPRVMGHRSDGSPIMAERLLCDHEWELRLARYERERVQREIDEERAHLPVHSEAARARQALQSAKETLWQTLARHRPSGLTKPDPQLPPAPQTATAPAPAVASVSGRDRAAGAALPEPPPWDGPHPADLEEDAPW